MFLLCFLLGACVVLPTLTLLYLLVSGHTTSSTDNSKESKEYKNEAVHAKTDWYHIAYGKVSGFDYNMTTTMFKIHHAILDAKTEKYNRFYTVYCKEISDACDSIKNMTTPKSKSEALHKISETYNVIFDTMLDNIMKEVERKNDINKDIEGVKNFAKINGDFDENYKAETVSKQISDTDTVLTFTTSEVENRAKNYATYWARVYEKISQYKEENTQLTKELEKRRAETEKHIDTTNSADKLKSDLDRIDKVISCQERAGRNGSTLELMRTIRRQIAKTGIRYGKDHYTDYKLYYRDIPIEDYLTDWEAEFDYTHGYFYYE